MSIFSGFTDKLLLLLHNSHLKKMMLEISRLNKGDKPYRSYIGINFSPTAIEDIKFYFVMHRKPESHEVNQLIPHTAHLFENYIQNWVDVPLQTTGGSGFTFCIKFDNSLKIRTGFYFKVKDSTPNDFYDLPETATIAYEYPGRKLYDDCKVVYVSTDECGSLLSERSLYYISDIEYKLLLSQQFKNGMIADSPYIEFCTNNKNYPHYRKTILIGNYHQISQRFQGTLPCDYKLFFADLYDTLGCEAFSPGFYADLQKRSVFLFNTRAATANNIPTIESLFDYYNIEL